MIWQTESFWALMLLQQFAVVGEELTGVPPTVGATAAGGAVHFRVRMPSPADKRLKPLLETMLATGAGVMDAMSTVALVAAAGLAAQASLLLSPATETLGGY